MIELAIATLLALLAIGCIPVVQKKVSAAKNRQGREYEEARIRQEKIMQLRKEARESSENPACSTSTLPNMPFYTDQHSVEDSVKDGQMKCLTILVAAIKRDNLRRGWFIPDITLARFDKKGIVRELLQDFAGKLL